MKLFSKIQQLATAQAFILAIVDANSLEFKQHLLKLGIIEETLKAKQKEIILTELSNSFL